MKKQYFIDILNIIQKNINNIIKMMVEKIKGILNYKVKNKEL